MKVGLVIYGSLDTVSGGYLYDRKLVAYLRACGDDVKLVSIAGSRYFPHLLDNFSFRLPQDVDIIIEDELVHPSVLAANRAVSAARTARVPLVSLVHNLHSSEQRPDWQNAFYRQIEKWHLESVDGCIFNSTITQASVSALIGDTRPYVLAPPGGDRLGSLSVDAIQRRLERGGPLRLLFLANVTPLKGLHVILDALDSLPAGTCTLAVAGSLEVDRTYAAAMRRRAISTPDPVAFHGILDGQSLIDLLAGSDVLVLPSSYEGFGIAFLEGMAFGLPAIGTTAGAIPQLVTHGFNGYLIQPGDALGLAELIRELNRDRELLSRLSLNARGFFDSCPTWDDSGAKVRRFLMQMLGRGNSDQPE